MDGKIFKKNPIVCNSSKVKKWIKFWPEAHYALIFFNMCCLLMELCIPCGLFIGGRAEKYFKLIDPWVWVDYLLNHLICSSNLHSNSLRYYNLRCARNVFGCGAIFLPFWFTSVFLSFLGGFHPWVFYAWNFVPTWNVLSCYFDITIKTKYQSKQMHSVIQLIAKLSRKISIVLGFMDSLLV